jgi:hypothetical protein
MSYDKTSKGRDIHSLPLCGSEPRTPASDLTISDTLSPSMILACSVASVRNSDKRELEVMAHLGVDEDDEGIGASERSIAGAGAGAKVEVCKVDMNEALNETSSGFCCICGIYAIKLVNKVAVNAQVRERNAYLSHSDTPLQRPPTLHPAISL